MPVAYLAADESMPTWDGAECTREKIALESLTLFNLIIGPCNIFIAFMFISMTVFFSSLSLSLFHALHLEETGQLPLP